MNYLNKKTIEDIDVTSKRVLMRCDFNVPFDLKGNISDPKRITESLKSINYLLEKGAKLILCSHLGRPNGKVSPKLSLRPVAKYLEKVLGRDVKFLENIVGEAAKEASMSLKDSEVMLLENTRFYEEETENDAKFSEELSFLADVFVNDAFGTAHRAHASTVGVASFLPSVLGFLMIKEISIVSKALKSPKKPFISILGGAKVSDKIAVIDNLLKRVDTLIIGGGMAYTFMRSLGYSIGTSICENDKLALATEIMSKAKEKDVELLLPIDNKVGLEYSPDTEFKAVKSDSIPEGWMGLDIGPQTEALFEKALEGAGTVIWNGPMGVAEWENFSSGTFAVAKAVANSGAFSIIGGGDSAAAVEKLGYSDKMSHISTGGGASLVLLGGKDLPAVLAADDKE